MYSYDPERVEQIHTNVEHEIAKGVWLKKKYREDEENKTQDYALLITAQTNKRVLIAAKF